MLVDLAPLSLNLADRGVVPDLALRIGIRSLLRQRLEEVCAGNQEASAELTEQFLASLRAAPLAPLPHKANEQHYELPPALFESMLGPQVKYSCCWWPDGVRTLEAAEEAALAETVRRADIRDGQSILELGCGWGALTLWMAARFPASQITAVSNSAPQRAYIERQAAARGLTNLRVLTVDVNDLGQDKDFQRRFDRIVSIEMFEHLRNWPRAFRNVSGWLRDGGRFFMHVFAHRGAPYAFDARDATDWMSQYFFSGGMMPSDDLALRCQDDLALLQRWRWSGQHYARTAAAWRQRFDAHREAVWPVLVEVYGSATASMWWQRWRMFLMAVEELFGYDGGQQWWVSHYLFEARR